MDEFWVCQHCRSLNRAGTGRCYHCREKFGSRPQAVPAVIRPGAGAPSLPRMGTGGSPVTASGSPPQGVEPPAYYSRPVGVVQAPVRDFSAPKTGKPERQFRRPQLTGFIRRRIAWSLATRQFVPIRPLGYVSAVLLTLLVLTGALIVTTFGPLARTALETGSLSAAWNQVQPGHQWTLELMVAVMAVVGVAALTFFSVFIGLSTHNAPGLGVDMPLLSPYRAGTCWLSALWTQVRIAVALLLPAALAYRGYQLGALLAALVALELGQRRLEGGWEWLSDPARFVPDILAKLGVSGSSRSLLGSVWAFFFRAANLLAIAVYALPILAIAAVAAANLAGRADLVEWRSTGDGPIQLAIAALVAPLILTTALAIGLLVPISIDVMERQKTRQTLVRVGRSRPWIARPGGVSASGLSSETARWDPYGRSYEDELDQASLNSPSTTSSLPWEEASSEEAPPG